MLVSRLVDSRMYFQAHDPILIASKLEKYVPDYPTPVACACRLQGLSQGSRQHVSVCHSCAQFHHNARVLPEGSQDDALAQVSTLWVVFIAAIVRCALVAVLNQAPVVSREPFDACPHTHITHHNVVAPVIAARLSPALVLSEDAHFARRSFAISACFCATRHAVAAATPDRLQESACKVQHLKHLGQYVRTMDIYKAETTNAQLCWGLQVVRQCHTGLS